MSRKQQAAVRASAITSGPLGPWRLTISVGVSTLLTGMPLTNALASGLDIDLALGRSFAVAFIVWLLTGAINRILSQAEVDRAADATVATVTPLGAVVDGSTGDLGAPPITGHAA